MPSSSDAFSPAGHQHTSLAPQWRQLAEMGYLGLTAPVDMGGQGLGAVELAVVCEEAGRVCLPGPLLDTVLATSVRNAWR